MVAVSPIRAQNPHPPLLPFLCFFLISVPVRLGYIGFLVAPKSWRTAIIVLEGFEVKCKIIVILKNSLKSALEKTANKLPGIINSLNDLLLSCKAGDTNNRTKYFLLHTSIIIRDEGIGLYMLNQYYISPPPKPGF